MASNGKQPIIPTFSQSLMVGGFAGTSSDLLFFPIDTVKTRLQSVQGLAASGGMKGIYKGVGSVAVGSWPGAAVFFATYDGLKKALPGEGLINVMVAASVGEVAACLVRVPTEVVKTRVQTSSYGEQGKSSLAAARMVFRYSGIRGFYSGFGSTMLREVPFTSMQFPMYEFFKVGLARQLGRRDGLFAHEAAACGCVAGGIAAAVTTPLDVLKTRIMLDIREPGSRGYPSIGARFMSIYRNEGMSALFAGVVPRTLWISAGGAVFLGMYEWAIQEFPK